MANNNRDQVIYFKNFDADSVSINTKPRQTEGNPSKRVYVNSSGRKPLAVSTPRMSLPFGVSSYDPTENGGIGEKKYYFEPSFKGMSGETVWGGEEGTDENLRMFHDSLTALSDKGWQATLENQEEWLGKRGKKKMTDSEAFRTSTFPGVIRENERKDGQLFPSTIRLKLPRKYDKEAKGYSDEFECEFFDKNNKKITIDEIQPGSEARFVIVHTGYCIVGDKVYEGWKCIQAKIYNNNTRLHLTAPAFYDDSDEDSDDAADSDNDEFDEDEDVADEDDELLQEAEAELAVEETDANDADDVDDEEVEPESTKKKRTYRKKK